MIGDSYGTIILALITAVVCVVLPTATIAHRNEVSNNQIVQNAITKFVDSSVNKGEISDNEYNNLLSELDATGELYDLNISISHIDENLAKIDSSSVKDQIKIGENVYYVEYTYQVTNELENDGKISLTQGDYVQVVAENVSPTMYQMFRKALYGVINQEKAISGQYSAMVLESYGK